MYCTWLAENTGCKKLRKNRHLSTITQLCRAVCLQLRHVPTVGKSLLNSNTTSTYPCNMVNFGPLTAEIGSGVWGIPANVNGFRVLRVSAWHSSGRRQPNFAALNRGRHLYSAGQPLRWALAHILVFNDYGRPM